MQDDTIKIKIEAKNPETASKLKGIVQSVDGMEADESGAADGTNLLIIELGEDTERDLQYVESLLGSSAVREVFLTSKDTTPQMLVKAIRTGAKEFLTQPFVDDEVRQALEPRAPGHPDIEDDQIGRSLACALQSVIHTVCDRHPMPLAAQMQLQGAAACQIVVNDKNMAHVSPVALLLGVTGRTTAIQVPWGGVFRISMLA